MDYESYLHEKGLKTFDPYGQIDLLPMEKQTPDKELLDIRNRYVVNSEKIFCHICGSKRHNNGFTGVISSGSAILFGSTCAKDYFSEEVLRHAERAFDHQEQAAFAEFNIKRLKSTAGEIVRWFQRFDAYIRQIADTWDVLLAQHEATIEEIFNHFAKHNNRLTEEFVEEASEISRAAGRTNRVVSAKLVYAIRNPVSIKTVREFRLHHRIASTMPSILLSIDDTGNQETLLELDQKLRTNFLHSLEEFERTIRMSVELFNEPAFSQICRWSDRQRIIKLRQAEVSPRDLAKTLRKKLGSGYELPQPMLSEIIAAENIFLGEKPATKGLLASKTGGS